MKAALADQGSPVGANFMKAGIYSKAEQEKWITEYYRDRLRQFKKDENLTPAGKELRRRARNKRQRKITVSLVKAKYLIEGAYFYIFLAPQTASSVPPPKPPPSP